MATPCEGCSRPVPAGEAAVSRLALGQVACWRCRGTEPNPDHERDARLESLAEEVTAANLRQWRALVGR